MNTDNTVYAMNTHLVRSIGTLFHVTGLRVRQLLVLKAILVAFAVTSQAQTVIYKEDFNTEGEGARYTVEGRGVFEGLATTGPAYWTRNVDVTAKGKVVGVPAPAPAKRAVLMFNHGLTAAALTPDAIKLIDGTIKWLTGGKAKLTVMFSAAANAGEGDQFLVQRLTEQGHTVVDDELGTNQNSEGLPDPATIDLVINGSSAGEPARLARYAVPLLSYRSAISGDLLLATRGDTALNFDPGEVKIQTPNHPIAAGLKSTFSYVTEAQPFDTIGSGLPSEATTVATYQYTDGNGNVSTRPLLVVIEKGAQMLGGLISGMEGTGYWAAADLNAPEIADGTFNTSAEPRSLTLKEVNVAGQPKLKLTFLLAGTEVDFDGPGGDDFLKIKVDIDGDGPAEFADLAQYGAPTGSEKFLIEMFKDGVATTDYTKRVGIVAKEFTYDLPAGATKLVVRFEGLCTFWNEIFAIDNIRITSGDVVAAKPIGEVRASVSGENLVITFKDGAKPFVLRGKATMDGPWVDLLTTDQNTIQVPLGLASGFFQVGEQAKNSVQLFKASLNGASEVPAVATAATGFGLLGLDAANKKANYLVTYNGLKGKLTGAHLHGPGDETQAVGVLFGITALPNSSQSGGAFVGTADLDDAKIAAIRDRKAYFNIHSEAHGSGEIRGQLKNP